MANASVNSSIMDIKNEQVRQYIERCFNVLVSVNDSVVVLEYDYCDQDVYEFLLTLKSSDNSALSKIDNFIFDRLKSRSSKKSHISILMENEKNLRISSLIDSYPDIVVC